MAERFPQGTEVELIFRGTVKDGVHRQFIIVTDDANRPVYTVYLEDADEVRVLTPSLPSLYEGDYWLFNESSPTGALYFSDQFWEFGSAIPLSPQEFFLRNKEAVLAYRVGEEPEEKAIVGVAGEVDRSVLT